MYQCEACKKRGKTWNGDDPVCGFDHSGKFNPENWNCSTLNQLRSIAWDNGLVSSSEDDNNVAIFNYNGYFLILGWYKNRGRTEMFQTYGYNENQTDYEVAKEVLNAFLQNNA